MPPGFAMAVCIRGSPAMVIIRSASIWMFASTVFADCRAMGCRLSSRMLLANDCMARAMTVQLTTTRARMFSVVFLRILPFRLRLIPRFASESVCFPITFQSLLFWYLIYAKEKPLVFLSPGVCPTEP